MAPFNAKSTFAHLLKTNMHPYQSITELLTNEKSPFCTPLGASFLELCFMAIDDAFT